MDRTFSVPTRLFIKQKVLIRAICSSFKPQFSPWTRTKPLFSRTKRARVKEIWKILQNFWLLNGTSLSKSHSWKQATIHGLFHPFTIIVLQGKDEANRVYKILLLASKNQCFSENFGRSYTYWNILSKSLQKDQNISMTIAVIGFLKSLHRRLLFLATSSRWFSWLRFSIVRVSLSTKWKIALGVAWPFV